MLLASAALHSLLFVVPIASNSTKAELSKGSNSPDKGTTKVSKEVCDEYFAQKAAQNSFSEEILGGVGEDSLGEDASVAGEDSIGEEIAPEAVGEDSLGEDASVAGEDSIGEEIAPEAVEDSLNEDASLAGEDSIGEEIAEEAVEDSLGEEIAEEDSLSEEIPEENTTPNLEELCKDESLPKGKGVKVPKETPLLGNLENGSNGEEIGDEEDAIPDLANGDSDDSLDESGDAADEIPTPTDDFSAGEDDISSEESPTTSENLSLGESESEPEIAFTPSESDDESTDDTVSETVDESTDDTVSETVDESIDDTVPEIVDESTEDTNVSETVDQPTDDTVSETIDSPEVAETELNPEETPSETNNQSKPRRVDPFANFPNYANVKPYVCGVQIARIDRRTRRTSDPLDSVQAYFDKKLAGTDFQVEKLTDKPDTKVYQVSRGNLTQFLQLFAVEEKGTMILLSSQRVDCYRLSNESLPEKPDSKTEQQSFDVTFQNLYAQLGWKEEKEFATTSEVETIFGKDINNTPEQLALLVKSKLESEGFAASQINKETSELLYEVKKGDFTKYISFVPAKEGKGAVILALKTLPNS
jgi:hypothetical protein